MLPYNYFMKSDTKMKQTSTYWLALENSYKLSITTKSFTFETIPFLFFFLQLLRMQLSTSLQARLWNQFKQNIGKVTLYTQQSDLHVTAASQKAFKKISIRAFPFGTNRMRYYMCVPVFISFTCILCTVLLMYISVWYIAACIYR